MASCSRRSVSTVSDDLCCVCFDKTNYICLICELPICNKCSIYEYDEETAGWMMGISVGYCLACKKPESKAKGNRNSQIAEQDQGAAASSTGTGSDDPAESDDENDQEFKVKKIQKKKSGRKTKWTQEMLNEFIDVIVSSEYYKKKLIFMNTKTQRNGEIYGSILKELQKRYAKKGGIFPFTVPQLRSKFKKCVSTCKQAAMTMKSASGIKRFQEDKGLGKWFNQLYSIVKTRDSCNPEIAIEPSALGNAAEDDNDTDMEIEDPVAKKINEDEGKDDLFIPIKREKKKKEDVAAKALQVLNKVVESDHTKDLMDFMKDQMQKSQEHELKVLQMILSSESVSQPRNTQMHGIDPVSQQHYMPNYSHWNPRPGSLHYSQPSSSSHSCTSAELMTSEHEPTYHPL